MLEDQTIEAPRERDTANRTNEVQAERARAVAVTQRVEHTGCRNDTTANSGSITALLPIMGVVLVAFLVIGIALPVLPLHVHQGLGLGTFVVGLVTGSQFAASLISRMWSGHYADSKGAKRAVVVGLLTAGGWRIAVSPVTRVSSHAAASLPRSCSAAGRCSALRRAL